MKKLHFAIKFGHNRLEVIIIITDKFGYPMDLLIPND
jgi:hypothetical protein